MVCQITREDLHAELKQFSDDVFAKQLDRFQQRVQETLRNEFCHLVEKVQPSCHQVPCEELIQPENTTTSSVIPEDTSSIESVDVFPRPLSNPISPFQTPRLQGDSSRQSIAKLSEGLHVGRYQKRSSQAQDCVKLANAGPSIMKADQGEENRLKRCLCSVHQRCFEMVESSWFEGAMATVIVANTFAIGVQADVMAKNGMLDVPYTFELLDLCFFAVFALELIVRVWVTQMAFFNGPMWRWNWFSTIIVLVQLVEYSVLLSLRIGDDAGQGGKDIFFFRMLRILRTIRIFRVVRMVRLVQELQTILVCLVGSVRHVFWTLVVQAVFIYTVAVYLTQLTTDHLIMQEPPALVMSANTTVGQKEPSSADVLYSPYRLRSLYGSLGASCMTLFEAVTGGIDYREATNPLWDEVSFGAGMLVMCYIAFTIFALFNAVTSVFVESAIRSSEKDRAEHCCAIARDVFRKTSRNEGYITRDDFLRAMDTQEMDLYFETLDVSCEDAGSLFAILDVSRSGMVKFDDFVDGCFRLRGGVKALDFAAFRNLLDATLQAMSDEVRQVHVIVERIEARLLSSLRVKPLDARSVDINIDKGIPGGVGLSIPKHISDVGKVCTVTKLSSTVGSLTPAENGIGDVSIDTDAKVAYTHDVLSMGTHSMPPPGSAVANDLTHNPELSCGVDMNAIYGMPSLPEELSPGPCQPPSASGTKLSMDIADLRSSLAVFKSVGSDSGDGQILQSVKFRGVSTPRSAQKDNCRQRGTSPRRSTYVDNLDSNCGTVRYPAACTAGSRSGPRPVLNQPNRPPSPSGQSWQIHDDVHPSWNKVPAPPRPPWQMPPPPNSPRKPTSISSKRSSSCHPEPMSTPRTAEKRHKSVTHRL
eukprot:TRINITY_DN4691_c0_g1_i1.p1 TRINITY_DN4691_c0_g1~~TRINITY_DN4691_c0_g1_i1.p1  ORF type:complete len:871 (+),score=106.46 TRINITY_DN4691_c0_g1_i1:151-2763(+)